MDEQQARIGRLTALLTLLVATGRCPICEHRLGNFKSLCHCSCHDPEAPYIDPDEAAAYMRKDLAAK